MKKKETKKKKRKYMSLEEFVETHDAFIIPKVKPFFKTKSQEDKRK